MLASGAFLHFAVAFYARYYLGEQGVAEGSRVQQLWLYQFIGDPAGFMCRTGKGTGACASSLLCTRGVVCKLVQCSGVFETIVLQ